MDAAVATFAGVVIVIAGVGVSEVVDWTRNPLNWEVKSYRWSVPLVKRGETPGMPNAVRISKVYVNPQYAKLMTERANYLKAKAGDRKLIYFSPDSYLMLRLSGVFPKQEYIDVSEALTFRCYWRLYCFIVESHEPEIYFDARDESTLHWCGQQFRMLRQHLSSHYTLTRVESGWEVWTRK